MELSHITYQGPKIDDHEVHEKLPQGLRSLLGFLNGFIQFGGGLHVRGACLNPQWHSIRNAWLGPRAFHHLYASVDPNWVPFAEDCVGDQFFLENNVVLRLLSETGEIESMGLSLAAFLKQANSDPVEFLSLEPLLKFQKESGSLQPEQLVHVYPPFCTEEAANGVSVRAVPSAELHQFHAEFATQLPDVGGQFRMSIVD